MSDEDLTAAIKKLLVESGRDDVAVLCSRFEADKCFSICVSSNTDAASKMAEQWKYTGPWDAD